MSCRLRASGGEGERGLPPEQWHLPPSSTRDGEGEGVVAMEVRKRRRRRRQRGNEVSVCGGMIESNNTDWMCFSLSLFA